ncbi:MAG: LysR substrate-binding domain-containing protein [Pigmentiphaga sp.]|uniref:LysR substrate-binding domain-containing protein n=1 Tax=Pigmentiphaga sp. TaxID=1977564 RepID=UPI003B57BEE7
MNALRMFDAAARHESFVKAAEELHVTHSAVGRQVILLEEWLGVSLFNRSARRITLSESGHIFWAEIRLALDKVEYAAESVRRTSGPVGEQMTSVAVNAPLTFSTHWLIPRLHKFHALHPTIKIRLGTTIDNVDLTKGIYDVAIRYLSKPSSATVCIPLFHTLQMPMSKPGLRLDVQDEPGLPWILNSGSPEFWSAWARKNCVDDRRLRRREYHVDQLYFAVDAALNGRGIAIAPSVLMLDALQDGRLCFPYSCEDVPDPNPYQLWTARTHVADSTARFIEWICAEAEASEQVARALIKSNFPS